MKNMDPKPLASEKRLVIIVEDDLDIQEILSFHFSSLGFETKCLQDGRKALDYIAEHEAPLLLVLDLMLPSLSGEELCAIIRSDGNPTKRNIPILMLTAKSTKADTIHGLNLGADDYMTKPFDLEELSARTNALLRRMSPTPFHGNLLNSKDMPSTKESIRIDIKQHRVWVNNEAVELTLSEFRLLQALMEVPGQPISRSDLIERIRGHGIIVVDRTIDFHVLGLRRKLGQAGQCISTVRGLGYRFEQ